MKTKSYVWVLVIAAVAIAVFVFISKKDDSVSDTKKSNNSNSSSESSSDSESGQNNLVATELSGTLQKSNDSSRGNLMLELSDSDKIIYMTSSRDFSQFYNKEVIVSIDGDLNNFTLVDIKAKD